MHRSNGAGPPQSSKSQAFFFFSRFFFAFSLYFFQSMPFMFCLSLTDRAKTFVRHTARRDSGAVATHFFFRRYSSRFCCKLSRLKKLLICRPSLSVGMLLRSK